MRGQGRQEAELAEFIAARSPDLYRDAYQLTGSQAAAERLVPAVLAGLRRDRVDLSRVGATAWLRMIRVAATDDRPPAHLDPSLPARLRPIALLSPRRRAVLVLQSVAGYDVATIARTLQLTPRATSELLASIADSSATGGAAPYEIRSVLEEFADRVSVPTPATISDDMRAVPSAPRRPWWTYVAAVVIVAVTLSSLLVTQGWHDDWLHTPDGMNHAHGTHFPTYTQGYRLMAVRELAPGITRDITTGGSGAVALSCDTIHADVHVSVVSGLSGDYLRDSCTKSFIRPTLTPFAGKASATIVGGDRGTYPVAIYRKIPRAQYPVATTDFDVQRDLSFDSVRRSADAGKAVPATDAKMVLTLRGTAGHPNGTFTGRLRLPSTADNPDASPTAIHAVGLLSPSTSGTFRVQVAGLSPVTGCGVRKLTGDGTVDRPTECVLVDRQVPQISFEQDVPEISGWVPVDITVTGARGPWRLQVVADAYPIGAGAGE